MLPHACGRQAGLRSAAAQRTGQHLRRAVQHVASQKFSHFCHYMLPHCLLITRQWWLVLGLPDLHAQLASSRALKRMCVRCYQASWVKMGPERAAALLASGCNDMGGSIMNESITRAAGAQAVCLILMDIYRQTQCIYRKIYEQHGQNPVERRHFVGSPDQQARLLHSLN